METTKTWEGDLLREGAKTHFSGVSPEAWGQGKLGAAAATAAEVGDKEWPEIRGGE